MLPADFNRDDFVRYLQGLEGAPSPQRTVYQALAENLAVSSPAAFAQIASRGRWRMAPHLSLINRKLLDLASRRILRLIVTLPPRHGKSTLISQFFPVWWLGQFPDQEIILTSYGASLAANWSGRARQLAIEFGDYLGIQVNERRRAGDDWNILNGEGAVRSAGVGTGVTGRGASLLVIDDPIKDSEEAHSPVIREKVWEWFNGTAFTRLEPGGVVIIIQCMTGDTPILMATGCKKSLRDIQVGDRVATYENGKVSASTVLNWANQGPDRIFEIRMRSGITVKANARHPFLIKENGEMKWQRTALLKKGSVILRVTGGSGKTPSAPKKAASDQPSARVCVCRTTTNIDGKLEFGRLPVMLRLGEKPVCDIATESALQSITDFLQSRAAFAPSVKALLPREIPALTGMANSASITVTKPEESVGCSATTVTWPSGMAKPKPSSLPPLSTFAITEDVVVDVVESGVEDVFDIQVERTENFIANGLVSHNTRWHEDDLTGRILDEMTKGGPKYDILNLPALAESDEEPFPRGMGRKRGEPLWPDRFNADALAVIRRQISERWWAALYQQRPNTEGGGIFRSKDFRFIDQPPEKLPYYVRFWDLASTAANAAKRDPDYTVGVLMGARPREGGLPNEKEFFILDVQRFRLGPEEVSNKILETARIDGRQVKIFIEQEPGASSPIVITMFERLLAGYSIRGRKPEGSKEVRADAFSVPVRNHLVYILRDQPWVRPLLTELEIFPSGMHDDQVDACSGAYGELLVKKKGGVFGVFKTGESNGASEQEEVSPEA